MSRCGIVLQARMGSSRLPGKALASVGSRTILEHCLRRLLAPGVAPVVLATTVRPEDEALAGVARDLGVQVFRGDAEDVLDRYVRCAAAFEFDTVIRATADNPGVDMQAPVRVLECLEYTDADYVREEGLPYGAAVEGIRTDALVQASVVARDAFDREHVTPLVRRRPDLFGVLELSAPAAVARPDVRLTVDTADDLRHVREVYERAGSELPTLVDLIAASDRVLRRSVA